MCIVCFDIHQSFWGAGKNQRYIKEYGRSGKVSNIVLLGHHCIYANEDKLYFAQWTSAQSLTTLIAIANTFEWHLCR